MTFTKSMALTNQAILAAVFSFACAVVVSAALLWRLDLSDRQVERARLLNVAADHARAIEFAIQDELSVANTLAALVRQGHGVIAGFEDIGMELIQSHPGISALSLSPGGIVREVVPLAGNEKSLGFNQLADVRQGREAAVAREVGKVVLAGPMNLIQGGLGAVGRLAVQLRDEQGNPHFWGFVNVVLRFPDSLVGARLPELREADVEYIPWRTDPGGQKQVIAASTSSPLANPIEEVVELPYGNWVLSVAKVTTQGISTVLMGRMATATLFACLIAYLAMQFMQLRTRKQVLERTVAARTEALTNSHRELAEREELLRQILDTASVAIFILNTQGRIVRANREMAAMFASTLEQLDGKDYLSLLDPGEMDSTKRSMDAMLAGDECVVSRDRQFCRADGTRFWGHLSGRPFVATTGELVGLIGVVVNVDQRKRVEEELTGRNQVLSAVVDNFPGAISLFDKNLNLVVHNRLFQTLLEFSDDLFIKPPVKFEDLIHFNALRGEYGPGDPHALTSEIVARARRFEPHRMMRTRPDGKVLDIRGIPLPGGGFVTIYLDVTEQKRVEEELRRHRDHLEELVEARTKELSAAKHAAEDASRAKSSFLANMSHELHTPLHGIMGMANLAIKRSTDPKQLDHLTKALSSAERLLGVIDDVLEIARIDSESIVLRPAAFSVSDVLRAIDARIVPLAAKKGLQTKVECAEDLKGLRVVGDYQRIGQVLFNFASNAVKFTERGSVVIGASASSIDDTGLMVRVSVSDTGIGIEAGDLLRIFNTFEQADGSQTRRFGGTGLGLAICKKVTELLGGKVGVESRVGEGSTFWLELWLNKEAVVDGEAFTIAPSDSLASL